MQDPEGQERKVKMEKINNVEWMSPEDLTPYSKNAKMHPAEQIERIANGIKSFGWTQPIVIDKDNVVVIGHGRLLAAKQLLLEKVPVVKRDDLTDDQIKALRLEDNKTNESAWDFSLLEEELAELSIADFDMTQFGFADPEEIEDIPADLDADEVKSNVVVSLNFSDVRAYETVKQQLQEIAESCNALIAVKMA